MRHKSKSALYQAEYRKRTRQKETAYIYALIAPDTWEVGYVGYTTNPPIRLRTHYSEIRTGRAPKQRIEWVASILQRGIEPQMSILETVPIHRAQERERYWIAEMFRQGYSLTNSRI